MKCPYCEHTFPLTWERYFKSPWGRHVCPRCSKPSRLKFRLLTAVIELIVGLLCAAPVAIVFQHWLGGYWALLGAIPTMLVTLPLDRMFDDKYKHLRPIEGEALSDTAACVECKRVFNVRDMVAHNGLHVCARCKPIFLQKIAEGAKLAPAGTAARERTRLVPVWFWVLLLVVVLAAMILGLLLHTANGPPM